jgi:hypothetical protein
VAALNRADGALCVVNAELSAVRVAEIELGEVAVKVTLAAVLINAFHATLENRVIALNRVRVDLRTRLAVCVAIFAARVIDNVVLCELIPDFGIAVRFIGHNMAFTVNVLADDWDYRLFGRVINMERASRSSPLNEREHRVLMAKTALDHETANAWCRRGSALGSLPPPSVETPERREAERGFPAPPRQSALIVFVAPSPRRSRASAAGPA